MSSYVIVLISCTIFWITYFLCAKRKTPEYSGGDLILMYIFARILPYCALEQRSMDNLVCLASEWLIIGLLYYYTCRRKKCEAQGTVMAFYLFQPGTACCIINGSKKGICAAFAVLALLCVLDTIEKKKRRSLKDFLPEYIIGNVGIYLWFYAVGVLHQSITQTGRMQEIPVCYIVSLGIMGIALTGIILRIFVLREDVKSEKSAIAPTEIKNKWERVNNKKKFGKWDYICISVLTIVFAVAVFFKLGSHHVPETFEHIQVGDTGENEIVLNFGKDVNLSKVYIYLGYQSKRIISFSEISGSSNVWNVFDSKHTITSAFAWNEVDINRPVRMLGMVLIEGSADINEVVCLDNDGNVILPENAEAYHNLFDEQQLFVKNATYFDGTMFDEIYHGRTAYEFLHGLSIYENTHPPLGKSIISIGIALFGMNPFGWRFMCAVCGVLMIPLMYLFAFKMFSRTDIACLTTILAGTGFMNTTLARIATIDIIVAFFVLLMFYCMYGYIDSLKEKYPFKKQMPWLLAGGIAMAFAVSTKWTGVYAGAGIAIVFFYFLLENIGGAKNIKRERKYLVKTFAVCVASFVIIPIAVYILSYIPFARVYTDKGPVEHAINNAELMLSYHSNCVFDHPYSSEWYEWLIDIKPLADSRVYFDDGTVSVVMTFLNPVLCFGGLVALVYQFYLWRAEHDEKALYLIILYLSMMIPWTLVHRTVFIYQYFISAMILPLMIGNAVKRMKHPRRNMIIIAIVSAVFYVVYYPVITGLPMNVEQINRFLEIFERWNIA